MPLENTSPPGNYLEAIEDDARCNFKFDITGGSGRCPYITAPGTFDIQRIVQDILGYTNPVNNSQAYLQRTIPRTHPKCPYLYAQRIDSIIGKGTGGATLAIAVPPVDRDMGVNPITPMSVQYPRLEIVVDFASRPYPIIDNDNFTKTVTGKWFVKNGNPNTFTYSPEWVRWCDYDLTPTDNTIQGQQGSLSMWGVPGKTSGIPFQSPPWMWLPDQILKVKWYQVPYRYIISSNSYIAGNSQRNWRGRINQNPWWNWPAGSLLYMGYSVTKYTPPNNEVVSSSSYLPTSTDKNNQGTVKNYTRLCDIELTFLFTNRYRSGSLGADITNQNYVAAGHNLLPNLSDNNFYYATRTPLVTTGPNAGQLGTASVQNPPAWYSFPVEALFTDPDTAGGPTTSGDN